MGGEPQNMGVKSKIWARASKHGREIENMGGEPQNMGVKSKIWAGTAEHGREIDNMGASVKTWA
ncbi:hypothetical protein [Lentibacillus sp. CBA3610]|uniref:hypothetical protein n=1 Tax=Lentibacillus sp. CBA3610 TaxID=2518176 RepID=UPI0015959EA8|nr:hypothetical protein [Lentibacillus sp. CBA3610]